MQLDIFIDGNKLKEQGIAQALNHADAVCPNWRAKAYNFMLDYMRHHKKFMVEDVRTAALYTVPKPPSNRAWGGIVKMAISNGLIKRIGFKAVKNPKAHGTPATVWQVLV